MINESSKSVSPNGKGGHDALCNLVRLHNQLTEGNEIDEGLASWLSVGIEALKTGSVDTIDCALGFPSSPGISKPGTQLRVFFRNRYLLTIMSKLKQPGESDWSLAKRASNEINKFRTRVWPRVSKSHTPSGRFNEIQVMLWELFRVDPDTPGSVSFLFELLRQPRVLTVEKLINT